jgi:hypothetical protein
VAGECGGPSNLPIHLVLFGGGVLGLTTVLVEEDRVDDNVLRQKVYKVHVSQVMAHVHIY